MRAILIDPKEQTVIEFEFRFMSEVSERLNCWEFDTTTISRSDNLIYDPDGGDEHVFQWEGEIYFGRAAIVGYDENEGVTSAAISIEEAHQCITFHELIPF